MIYIVRQGTDDGVGVVVDEDTGKVTLLWGNSFHDFERDTVTVEFDFGEARYLAELILHELKRAVE